MSKAQALRITLYTVFLVIAIGGWVVYTNQNLSADLSTLNPEDAGLFVSYPEAKQIVTLPIEIKGSARVFAGVVNITVEDSAGYELYRDFFQTNQDNSSGLTGFSYWIQSLNRAPVDDHLIVKVFWQSPNSDLERNLVTIPLILDRTNATTVDIFYSLSGGGDNCTDVAPLTRVITKNNTPAKQAIYILLDNSLSASEEQLGFINNFPAGVTLNSLSIQDGIARVDFSKELNTAAGSCRVLAIRSQVEHTLRQFRTINDIIITADGGPTLNP